MKFERAKTEKSKKRLKKVFYFTFFFWLSAGIVRLLSSVGDIDIQFINSSLNVLVIVSFAVLIIMYVIHIFVEGLEKPKFVPTETHNKVKSENANECGRDVQKGAHPF